MHFSGRKTAPAYVSYSYSPFSSPSPKLAEKAVSKILPCTTQSHGFPRLSILLRRGPCDSRTFSDHFKRGLTGTVPTYPLAPAHMTSVPGSMHTLQASTSLPTQQGRIGQTTELCRDWHATSLQGKCAGNAYCQGLGNKQSLALAWVLGPEQNCPTHPLTTDFLLGTIQPPSSSQPSLFGTTPG